jgi:hypothetical protein
MPAATAITLTGPTSAYQNAPSSAFTVGANGTLAAEVVVIPSDGGAGGDFDPPLVAINVDHPTATFTYTPSTAGARTISVTNTGSLSNPASITCTATATTTPAGFLSIPISRLIALVDACNAWTTLGGSTADLYVMAAPDTATRPFAVAADTDQWLLRVDSSGGTGVNVTDQGALLLIIERGITAGQTDAQAAYEFRNLVGDLITEMLDKSGTGSAGSELLWITGLRMSDPPMRAHPRIREDEGDFYQCVLEITYGIPA